jgi:D-serine deaminase-like pyridoxal phosphate-dependent protein
LVTSVSDLDEIDTPALVVDLDVMEANLASMTKLVAANGVALRPNVKGHKIPAFAWQQVRGGAAGITCQKLSEAEVMVDAGLPDVLIAVQVIGATKVDRLLRLARRARLTTVVDSLAGAEPIARACAASGMTIDVLLEVDIGYHRCGVEPSEAPSLARSIARLPGLNLVGVMGYEGHLYDLSGKDAVEAAARRSYELLTGVAGRLREDGIDVARVSVGASAGTQAAVGVSGITEVRAGSYLFNDRAQIQMGWAEPATCAATVMATVISVPTPVRAVTDAGAKALTPTTLGETAGFGLVLGHEDAVLDRLSDEHGMISLGSARNPFSVGDRVRIIPNSHTVVFNQFAEVHGVRKGRVEAVLPVAARAMMQ